MRDILENLEVVSYLFFGIDNDNLYLQIATRDNVIVFEKEIPARELILNTTEKTVDFLLSTQFKKSGIKVPRVKYFYYDGQKIFQSGKTFLLNCERVEEKYPQFSCLLFSRLMLNGKF